MASLRKIRDIETPTARGGLRYHRPLDNSVETLEAEELPYGASHFEQGLLEDMRSCSQSLLERHYPELIFGLHDQKDEPKKRDFRVKVKGGWRWGDWRRA